MSDDISGENDGILVNNKKVQIVYFSGTGGTERTVLFFQENFAKKGFEVLKVPLDMQKDGYQQIPKIEDSLGILIVVYPVYAFDAPNLVYDWINKVSNGTSLPCAVISVSGGGETWPNLSCRAGIIKLLSEKGFNVFYERMFVMPSNVFFQTKDQLAIQIINILPKKVEHCVNEIVLGVKRRKEYSNSKERKQSKKNMQDFGKNFGHQ